MLASLHRERTRAAKPQGFADSARHSGCSPNPRGEQNSAAHPHFKTRCKERNSMFQQNKAPGYMQELDAWMEDQVIKRLFEAHAGQEDGDALGTTELICREVKEAIRKKILD